MAFTEEEKVAIAALEREACLIKLRYGGKPVQELALDAIDAGLYSPSPNLADLAMSPDQDYALWNAALRDYGIEPPSTEKEAALRFTLISVRAVIDGRMSPAECSDQVWAVLNPYELDDYYHRDMPMFTRLTSMLDSLEDFRGRPIDADSGGEGSAVERLLRLIGAVMEGEANLGEVSRRLLSVLRDLPEMQRDRMEALIAVYVQRSHALRDLRDT